MNDASIFSAEKSSIPYESQVEGDYPILYESGDLSAQFYQAIQLLKTLNLNVKYFGIDSRTKKEKVSRKALLPRPEKKE